ncbi:MAG: carbohydrate binding domain-containing protein [Pirellulales bacterium]|nr:carbohydrate binding domain-containing protein [Pirellulales bacterium]
MSPVKLSCWLLLALLTSGTAIAAEPTGSIVVDLTNPGPAYPRTMHGIFFEDINYAADGGLYAELVQNRSFEHRNRLTSWQAEGAEQAKISIGDAEPLDPNNEHYLVLEAAAPAIGVSNSGFDGIRVEKGKSYRFSLFLRTAIAGAQATAALVDDEGRSLGEVVLRAGDSQTWQSLSGTITADDSHAAARLRVLVAAPGRYELDMVSLFPTDTFHGRANGLRADLAQLLADMRPGFMRFPGGCIVEGNGLANAYRWKDTIDEPWRRRQNWNLWSNNESPQYHQTYGLGFFEYFQLCEDMGAEPLPVLNCGMACQFRGGGLVPLEELDPWVQDALDLVEFANGAPETTWGAKRAAMGHPEPFDLKYVAIGNEQWGADYFARYEAFQKTLAARHPEIKLISTSGAGADGREYDDAWRRFYAGLPADLVDEHYYRPPQWFLDNHRRYDSFRRNGPKVFAGEFAAHGSGRRNNMEAALAEAAFMTGLWRNADVVAMACYAPLFGRFGHAQWAPDLIWFDNERSFGSPSYYVQQVFSTHLPELMAPVRSDLPQQPPTPFRGRIGIGTWLTEAEFKDVKVVRSGETLYEFDPEAGLAGWETHNGQWSCANGVLRQSSRAENVRLFVGDPNWENYTLSLKARKLGGEEGFLVSFASTDPGTANWWNLGGWRNRLHGLELRGATAAQVPGQIETGRWYSIRIEIAGAEVRCYLDDKLVQEFALKPRPALYAAAGYNSADHEAVILVVNPTGDAVTTPVTTTGRTLVKGEAQVVELTAEGAEAENSLDEPRRVAPISSTERIDSLPWRRSFAPYSVTVIKTKTAP